MIKYVQQINESNDRGDRKVRGHKQEEKRSRREGNINITCKNIIDNMEAIWLDLNSLNQNKLRMRAVGLWA